jgi:hypothetical protein
VLGCRFRFQSDGSTLRYRCARGCGAGGEKRYGTAEEAARYAAAFDRRDADDIGVRAPLGATPLRLIRRRRAARSG